MTNPKKRISVNPENVCFAFFQSCDCKDVDMIVYRKARFNATAPVCPKCGERYEYSHTEVEN